EFFEMLLSDYERVCEQNNLSLHTSVHVSGQYEIHPNQMMRVVDNLVSNAIHHTSKEGNIWLGAFSSKEDIPTWLFPSILTETFDTEKNMYMCIQNEGADIPEDEMEHVFDPLFQVDKARRKEVDHGTGLGLSIT